ncbi:MAG: PspC domain-containing protein [Brooklawnia sp.]|jgi:phage shock protein C
MSERKLTRSRDRRVIAGVCGGLADYFDIDVTLIRLGLLVASLFSAGLVAGGYLVAWLVIPDQGSGDTGADQIYFRYGDYKRRRAARQSGPAPDQPTDTFHSE